MAQPGIPVPGSPALSDTSSSGSTSRSAQSGKMAPWSSEARRQYDGNEDAPLQQRDPNKSRLKVSEKATKNLDLGSGAWAVLSGGAAGRMPPRLAPSKQGQAVNIKLNTFAVQAFPTKTVYQYDVVVNSGSEKRGLIMKCWESKPVAEKLGKSWIFDGNKLAWSLASFEREQVIDVDLDAEQGRAPNAKDPNKNKHRVIVRQTNRVAFDFLENYLAERGPWDNKSFESINYLDHLLREHPKLRYTAIKRNFFARGDKRVDLGKGIEAFKGVYASLRIVMNPMMKGNLSVNVDVANGTFWSADPLHNAAANLAGKRDVNDLMNALRRDGDRGAAGRALRKMRRLRVLAKHRGLAQPEEFVIDRFVYKSARDEKFTNKDGKTISVFDHFNQTYNIRLQYPDLPLVRMTRGQNTVLPMEILRLKENQRYNFKCDEMQTANMIKFAVTPPDQRWAAVEHGLKMLDWSKDPVHQHFGMKIDTKPTTVQGRLLPAPKVQYGQGEANPGVSGRWDLRGKKFLTCPTAPLKSWAVCVFGSPRGGKPDRVPMDNFVKEFIRVAIGHGMKIENKNPPLCMAMKSDDAANVQDTWNAAGNQSQMRPQILIFILPDRDSVRYNRIKRSGECRFGVVTQCMQYGQVVKCQGQYISNVCMKFNAKLGGSSCKAVSPKSNSQSGMFTKPTIVVGADVSHGAPGTEACSMAAMTASMDRLAIRYAAACALNGHREEMIQPENIDKCLKPLVQAWASTLNNGYLPDQLIYFRDGVSGGQHQHVLDQEVKDMKHMLRTLNPKKDVQFVVVVCSKRHHVRFFPEKGDRNKNPLPGTLVEHGVTQPFENDFYLNSHAAIKGTARPMHYHVILNEPNVTNEWLHSLIYEHCYQFIRSTTPVSQHPAVYYAHIASNRAIPHEEKWGQTSPAPSTGGPSKPGQSESKKSDDKNTEKLLEMPIQGGIRTAMWFV